MSLKDLGILDLRPTQFVLGMKEILYKVKKMSAMSAIELKKYCDEHVIPVVIGPHREVYLIDHHHFARACWETKTTNFKLKVLKDLSGLSEKAFWNYMIKENWVYLHDQFGLGPHLPEALPIDVRCMADDPYRSLAWAVREQGAIKKVSEPFFEFRWATFFRQNLKVRLHSKSDFQDSITEAIALAKSKEAQHLPGFAKSKSKK